MSTQASGYSLDSLGWRRNLLVCFLNIKIWSKLQSNPHRSLKPLICSGDVTSSGKGAFRTLAIKSPPTRYLPELARTSAVLTRSVSSSRLFSRLLAPPHPPSAMAANCVQSCPVSVTAAAWDPGCLQLESKLRQI